MRTRKKVKISQGYHKDFADFDKFRHKKAGKTEKPTLVTGKHAPAQDGFGLNVQRKFTGLQRHFRFAPFSILRTMEGAWMKRKRQWLALGIKSEVGRGNNELDISATMAGITDPDERKKWNAARRASPRHAKRERETSEDGTS